MLRLRVRDKTGTKTEISEHWRWLAALRYLSWGTGMATVAYGGEGGGVIHWLYEFNKIHVSG